MVVDALSRKNNLMTILRAEVTSFEDIKQLYETDSTFSIPWKNCVAGAISDGYSVQDGFLFKNNRFCIPDDPIREN